jgi:hypothetical protein
MTLNTAELWLNEPGCQCLLQIENIIQNANILFDSNMCVIKCSEDFYFFCGLLLSDSEISIFYSVRN